MVLEVGVGIAIGAATSPFWMMVWGKIKALFVKAETQVETKLKQ